MWDAIMRSIIETSKENAVQDADDYKKDGILYCHKCNTPKQCVIPDMFGGMYNAGDKLVLGQNAILVPCQCQCEQEREAREREASRQQARIEKINHLRTTAFQEERMRTWTFDLDDGKDAVTMRHARQYVRNFPAMLERGKGLLFYGGVGSGKTFTAACIANALIDQGRPCIMTNFPRIINTISGMRDGKQEYIDQLNDCDLLVIDDLAVERQTDYAKEIIFNVLDARCRIGYPLIVTTNLSAEELKNTRDVSKDRIYSRLLQMCHPVKVNGADRRRTEIVSDYAEIEALLNQDEPSDDLKGV